MDAEEFNLDEVNEMLDEHESTLFDDQLAEGF